MALPQIPVFTGHPLRNYPCWCIWRPRVTPAPRHVLPLVTRLLHEVVHLVMNFLAEKIPPSHVLLETGLARGVACGDASGEASGEARMMPPAPSTSTRPTISGWI